MEDQDPTGLLKTVPEKLLSELYKDLAQPGVRQLGSALENVLGCAHSLTLPLKYWNEERRLIFEGNMQRLRNKMAEVPAGTVCRVVPEIGVPILEKLTYVTDEYISELFLNLLKTASCQDTVNLAHPSFVRVIEHLSGDEARILLQFRDRDWCFAIFCTGKYSATREVSTFGSQYGGLDKTPGLRFPENMEVYLANLEGLGILKADADPREFEEDHPYWKEHDKAFDQYETEWDELEQDGCMIIDHYERLIRVTAYGRMFIGACTSTV
jgi:hypothetical protein